MLKTNVILTRWMDVLSYVHFSQDHPLAQKFDKIPHYVTRSEMSLKIFVTIY